MIICSKALLNFCQEKHNNRFLAEVNSEEGGKNNMKKYAILFLIYMMVISIIDSVRLKIFGEIESWWGNLLGIIIYILPLWKLLWEVHKDDTVPEKYRIISKGLFVFLIVCLVLGAVLNALERLGVL